MAFGIKHGLRIVTIQNKSVSEPYPESEYNKILLALCFFIGSNRYMPDKETIIVEDKEFSGGRFLATNGKYYNKNNMYCQSPWSVIRDAACRQGFSDELDKIRERMATLYNDREVDRIKAFGKPLILPNMEGFFEEYLGMVDARKAKTMSDNEFQTKVDNMAKEFYDALNYSVKEDEKTLATLPSKYNTQSKWKN